jgi:hypothetical protein
VVETAVSATAPAAASAQDVEAVLGAWREAETKPRRIKVARLAAIALREAIRVVESILMVDGIDDNGALSLNYDALVY